MADVDFPSPALSTLSGMSHSNRAADNAPSYRKFFLATYNFVFLTS